MPLMSLTRLMAAMLSLFVLGLAAYLLWSWYQGEVFTAATGELIREREPWRLWTGGALLAWSFLGRLVLPLVLAGPSRGKPDLARSEGQTIVSATGAEIYVEQHGPADAPLIVFTHGWGMDSTFWNAAKRDLGERYRLVTWDLPGLGKSKLAPDREVSLERYADELAALTRLSGASPAVLVGHSIGGMIIQTLVRDRPEALDRVAGVVLLNTTYTNPL
ncbi:MAG: alpha/beta hydrolase, partial [Caulobacteraceae bacterium]|nr:alpha/beta hydrolase [Caulobacteraceae bacterium]